MPDGFLLDIASVGLLFWRIVKTNHERSRKSAAINNSRWLAYATAGAASALTCANSAEATIHYSGPINRIINRDIYVTFQLDQPGDSIRLFDRTGTASYYGYDWFGAHGRAGASVAGFYKSYCCAKAYNLKRGQLISNNPFVPSPDLFGALLAGCYYCQFEGGIGFIGFKFNNGSGDQYGWVRIQTRPSFGQKFRLLDFAYGDVGDRIAAGQKRDEPNNLELGSLGSLALGAVGVLAWRKRRSTPQAVQPTQGNPR